MTQRGPWTVVSSREVYSDPWINVQRDEVIRPDGLPGSHCIVSQKRGVSVLAMDDDENVYLTNEFHYAINRYAIELVSGGSDGDEPPLETARRELAEELGIQAGQWTDLGAIDPFTSIVLSPTTLFLARDLTFGESNQEGTEQIRLVKLSFDEALDQVVSGRISHAPSCVAILKTARLLGR